MSKQTRIGDCIKTPLDACSELQRLEDCLALQGYFVRLFACSAPPVWDYGHSLDNPIHSLALDEFGPALATSSFQALLLAVNSAGVQVHGLALASFGHDCTTLQHLWEDESAGQWFYYDEAAAYACTVERAMLDIFRLLLWRAYLEGLLSESACVFFRPSSIDAAAFQHLAEAPLMLRTSSSQNF